MINVNKIFLPPLSEYQKYLEKIWDLHWVTNDGPMLKELERRLLELLQCQYLQVVGNGTIAIQIALKALEIEGEVITTPYSYVATTGALLWENCQPVFCDINSTDFCINANLIEQSISPRTTGILATHVYGLPCDVEKIQKIADKHNLKVIYDAAHAFGCIYKGKSLLLHGDVSTCSLHATKVYHSIEGGLVITGDSKIHSQMALYKAFGHIADEHYSMGINAKNSEVHAAMGLCMLEFVKENLLKRKRLHDTYKELLIGLPLTYPQIPGDMEYNYAYFPVLFESEKIMLNIRKLLADHQINTRRYFYPSLNTLPYLKATQPCPVSEDVATRVLCLPFYADLTFDEVRHVCDNLRNCFR